MLNIYKKLLAINKLYVMRNLLNLKIDEGVSVANNIIEFNMVINQLNLSETDLVTGCVL